MRPMSRSSVAASANATAPAHSATPEHVFVPAGVAAPARGSVRASSRARWAFIVLLAVVAALVALPAPAHAGTFETPSVDITAHVRTDGTLEVTERRTFEFTDDVNGIFWTIPYAENQQGEQSSVGVGGIEVTDESGETRSFTQVGAANNGDSGVYTVEQSYDSGTIGSKIKVFSPARDGDTLTVTVRYTMTGAVMAWDDTAELYWQFVGPGWEDTSNNVSLTVTFDAASVAAVPPVMNVDNATFRAWGHGELTGEVSLSEDGSVTFTVPAVNGGDFAEARIAFPHAWVVGLAVPSSAAGTERLPQILGEEQAWADAANARREQARQTRAFVSTLQVAVPAVLLAIVGAVKMKFGRSPKPVFAETYFRDVPSADHPAVIAAFMNGGAVVDETFTATLMKLTDERVIGLSSEEEETGLIIKRTKKKYRLELLDPARREEEGIDGAALRLFFRTSKTSASFDSLKSYASDNAEGYTSLLDDYKSWVTSELEQRNLVASAGTGAAVATGVVGGLAGLCVFWSGLTYETWPTMCVGLVCCIAAVAIGFTFRRLTQEGAELQNKCLALKKWLEEFTRLNEAVPEDLVLWNKLLVMAVALGVSEDVVRALADLVPQEEVEAGGYYPLYWWFHPHYGHRHSPMSSMQSSYTASVAALASSSSSSGGGFGGGFSGGGGGGVGGGGGGSF